MPCIDLQLAGCGADAVQGLIRAGLRVEPVAPTHKVTSRRDEAIDANRLVPEAVELQKRAVTLPPQDNGLRLNLAKIAVTAGDRKLARKQLKALESVEASLPFTDEVPRLLASF